MEERAYRALLAHPMATAAEMASYLSVTRRVARQLLSKIESKGLASHTPRVPRVYIAAPPEFTIAAMIRQRQITLDKARMAIPELKQHVRRTNRRTDSGHPLEVITSRARLGLVVAQMHKSCRTEAMIFQRAPVIVGQAPVHKLASLARVRSISDTTFLAAPGAMGMLQEDMAHGEEARTIQTLPFKMIIVDRRVGIITLDDDAPEAAPALLLNHSALLDALCLLFEFVWENSTPILSVQGGEVQTAKAQTHQNGLAKSLIPLLAAGLNDKAIAAEAGISSATINRRISELMKIYGTRTRFQLGWRAALDAKPTRASATTKRTG